MVYQDLVIKQLSAIWWEQVLQGDAKASKLTRIWISKLGDHRRGATIHRLRGRDYRSHLMEEMLGH